MLQKLRCLGDHADGLVLGSRFPFGIGTIKSCVSAWGLDPDAVELVPIPLLAEGFYEVFEIGQGGALIHCVIVAKVRSEELGVRSKKNKSTSFIVLFGFTNYLLFFINADINSFAVFHDRDR